MAIFKQRKQVVALVDPVTREPIEIEEDKPYLLILADAGSEDFEQGTWFAMRGRKTVFDYLISSLGNYELLHSYVLSGKISLGGEVSVYSFLRLCLTKHFVDGEHGLTVDELDSYAIISDQDQHVDLNLLYANEMNQSVSKE